MAESKESKDAKAAEKSKEEAGVATEKQNQALEHSEGGETTRDDALDAGVPMLQGDASEPVGPEDALGKGEKRGDYAGRQDGSPHLESVPTEDGGEPITDDDGNVVDVKPRFRLEDQTSRVEEVGEVEGKKGGVETASA